MTNNNLLKDYLLNNINEAEDIVHCLNSWNGCLDFLEYYENDKDFFDTYFYQNPDEAVRAVCYGEYNYTDDLVHFNVYGNLESISKYDYEALLIDNIDEIIEALIDEYENIADDLSEDVKKYINDKGDN